MSYDLCAQIDPIKSLGHLAQAAANWAAAAWAFRGMTMKNEYKK